MSKNPTFIAPPETHSFPIRAWVSAGLIVLALVAGLLLVGRRRQATASNVAQPLDSYAANLPLSQLAMSESTSLSGGKSTYIDGLLHNTGHQTVTAVTVQVAFRNEEQMPPAIEMVPLSLIRVREPYIDIQPVSASPLQPASQREFRLIFESIPGNWNHEMPEVRIVRTDSR